MIRGTEDMGLRVESITPEPHMINVDVNDSIKISFNSDLNTTTVVGNFLILADKNLNFKNLNSLKDLSNFEIVKGDTSYKDKVISFKPSKPLDENTRYIVCIQKEGIKDVLGVGALSDYVSLFYTETTKTLPKCTIIEPAFGSINESFPSFKWLDQQASAYIFQVSKEPTFEIVECDVLIRDTTSKSPLPEYSSDLSLDEGLYYARVKSNNGTWSDNHQFFIKDLTNATTTQSDTANDVFIQELLEEDEEHEVLEMFPNNDSVGVDLRTNIIYLKISGEVKVSDIDFSSSFVYGDLSDEDDEEDISPHGFLQGEWVAVYDGDNDVTYVIFTPKELGGGLNEL